MGFVLCGSGVDLVRWSRCAWSPSGETGESMRAVLSCADPESISPGGSVDVATTGSAHRECEELDVQDGGLSSRHDPLSESGSSCVSAGGQWGARGARWERPAN